MTRKMITMGEAKERWMHDLSAHPGRHSADERALARACCGNEEPNPHFRSGWAMSLLSPYIEIWAAVNGLGIVHM